MVGSFVFDAELRTNTGKGDARRLRRAGKVPAVLYGGNADPIGLVLEHNKVVKSLESEAVYSHVLTVKVSGREERAILKGLQRHPSKPIIMHMDFQRVSRGEKIRVHVPLHFVNQDISVGVKKGGVVTHNLVDVEVACTPDQLPEYIEVDLAHVDVGQSVHLSDLKVPEGVEILALAHGPEHDLPVAAIQSGKVAESSESPAE
ncbi:MULTISPECIES: 50S ribosomal protein L25/general stress protein Ctc [unclassified Methylocaldum]|jgi:large subunit ribosomal protein L25|uniref:50S ribosomal protein L25/general stress protein Ctc n=1 Tax=unclassified Methylocaldum TaxID=2622260 RepID=UPI00098BA8FC|nr:MULTISPECIES: 50S ribosomal protein L25/general stress protein Ctc [unclassified Methylocaldum]MBP1149511.1 large subunit ribosomal protein L25 [Methylocaldum sp. RMAD-M]MDV3240484.1 50S ribosomal protein L25/general stress protein Ctc [Methylocaldum sp.]MVF23520.1 50S ribosomal protein L25/general stress protein Ctc [Methylocaldum sp. BRCS4]